MELLAFAVKRDREAIYLTQQEVDSRALEYAVRNKLSPFFTRSWCGKIERCVARDISIHERKILAVCLEQPEDRYLGFETDPRKYIGRLLAEGTQGENFDTLERSIVFPPEYKQSGVSILT